MKKIVYGYFETFTSLNFDCKFFLLLFLIRSYSAGMVYYIVIYLANLHLDANIIGHQISLLVLGNLLGSLFASHTLNYQNVLKCNGFSLLVQGLCFLMIACSKSQALLTIFVFLTGFSGYVYQISSSFLITNLSGSDEGSRSRAVTLLSVLSNLGLGTGGAAVSLFSENHAQFLFFSTGLLLILFAMFYFKKSMRIFVIVDKNIQNDGITHSKYLLSSLLSAFVLGVLFAQHRIGLNIFIHEYFSHTQMSCLIMLNSLLIILFLPMIRPFLIEKGNTAILGFGILLSGGGMFLLQYATSFFWTVLLCIIWTFGEMIATTLSHFMCYQSTRKEQRAKAMSIYKFLYATGTFLGALLGTALLSYFSLTGIWHLCGYLGFIMFVIMFLVRNRFLPGKYSL